MSEQEQEQEQEQKQNQKQYTDDEVWIIRAGLEALMDYQKKNNFPIESRTIVKDLWKKTLEIIDKK